MTLFYRFYDTPVPEESVLFHEATVFRIAGERHLKSKSRLAVAISLTGDVYRLLFKNKGIIQDGWHLLSQEDLPARYFPSFGDHLGDSHDQGIKVMYPIKVRHFISWSSKKYSVEGDHFPTPLAIQEKFTFIYL